MACVSGKVRIPNLTDEPKTVKRHEHFCQICSVANAENVPTNVPKLPTVVRQTITATTKFSEHVNMDPNDILSRDMKEEFRKVLIEYDEVFNPTYGGYNGAVGPYQARVNMGPVQPPQRKGRVPQYARDKLVELQQKFDELEQLGVFKKPEDLNINVEYLNPSFLVKKPNGGFRLVTAFAEVARYSKPQPALMPDVDSTLRQIAQWRYIIATDLASAFYQIPLAKDSLKYCGVATPFKGVRVYVRSAMGMPGSEVALEELMCRVLGDLLQEGVIAKLADDLYCGGNTPEELLNIWRRILQALHHSGLNLSASKTVIAPKSTTILGWVWNQGTIQTSTHRISTLTACSPPEKVKGLRSFIGAYKVLARVLPGCAMHLAPLDDAVAGKASTDKLNWSEELVGDFHSAQAALANHKAITLPRPQDKLWIITDGAVKRAGIGATLYVLRGDQLQLAGCFSAKLRKQQVTWLPCEVEALAITVAIKHFSPYIVQSRSPTCVLTDSKPCVQAFEKLCRGEFSASPRVATFLSMASRYTVSIRHIAGIANLPSDHASRNTTECPEESCQICQFIRKTEESVVRAISLQDILSGNTRLPFTGRHTWQQIQSECADLRRTHAHLKQGTRPSKKLTNIKDIKRYLNRVTIARDGLLIVKHDEPFAPTKERIVVPRSVSDGLMTALHVQLNHPTCHQLKTVAHRYFFALDMDKAIEQVTSNCHMCASLRKVPNNLLQQSTDDPPEAVGLMFAADVLKRNRQLVLVMRECITSYTTATLIQNEQHDSLREGLISLCVQLQPLSGPTSVIRTDAAPAFMKLREDEILQKHHIKLEIGRVKNINKNPVAEKAIQEVEEELLKTANYDRLNRTITPRTLAVAVAAVNTRIRARGLSSREMWMQRDQWTNEQIPIDDYNIITQQHNSRTTNHRPSERSKYPKGKSATNHLINVGDIVYLYSDKDKTSARKRYLVVSTDKPWCHIKKFTGGQLRSASYKVKYTECYKVPARAKDPPAIEDSESEEEDYHTQVSPDNRARDEGKPEEPDPEPVTNDIVGPEIPAQLIEPGETQPALQEEQNVEREEETVHQQPEPPEAPVENSNSTNKFRRSTRTKSTPKWLRDYEIT